MARKQASSRLIPAQHHSPVSTSSEHFRHLNGSSRVFAFLVSYLMPLGAFSVTLTTGAFDQRRLRWFATRSCKPIARGQPPSLTPLAAAH